MTLPRQSQAAPPLTRSERPCNIGRMGVLEITFALIFVLGMLASRIVLVGTRGGIQQRNVVLALIGMIATFVTLSLVVWGFASLAWYWPIATFVAGSVIIGLIVTRSNWGAWFAASPFLDVIAGAGGLYLWIWHWPF